MQVPLTINSRGVITLPAKLRKVLGLKADDQLIAETTPEGLLLRPAVTLPVETYSADCIRELDEAEAELAQILTPKRTLPPIRLPQSQAARPPASGPGSSGRMRIVLDANVLFSAAKSSGAVRTLLARAEARGHRLCPDAYVAAEAREHIEAHFGALYGSVVLGVVIHSPRGLAEALGLAQGS